MVDEPAGGSSRWSPSAWQPPRSPSLGESSGHVILQLQKAHDLAALRCTNVEKAEMARPDPKDSWIGTCSNFIHFDIQNRNQNIWPLSKSVVQWLYYSERIKIVRWADLSVFFSFIFVGKMCVFVSRPMKIDTFLRKNDYTPKRVVDFPGERDTFRNKIMEIV